jgi:hypothetical protein
MACEYLLKQVPQLWRFPCSYWVENSLIGAKNSVYVDLVWVNLFSINVTKFTLCCLSLDWMLQIVRKQFQSVFRHVINQSLWKFKSTTNLSDADFWAALKY